MRGKYAKDINSLIPKGECSDMFVLVSTIKDTVNLTYMCTSSWILFSFVYKTQVGWIH